MIIRPVSLSLTLLATAALFAASPAADARPRGFAYNAAGQLFSFDLTNPGAVTPIGAPAGPDVKGLDLRPSTTTLYAIDVNATTAQLFTVNPADGVRTPVGAGFATSAMAPTPYSLDPAAGFVLDFNPTTLQPDGSIRIRFVGSNGVNLRLNSDTGTVAAVDGSIAYTSGTPATSAVSGGAYTNSDTARAGGTAPPTALYYIDTLNDNLVLSPNANAGLVDVVGPLGADVGPNVSFDIATANGQNIGYIVVTAAAGVYTLHTVNLTTGAASPALGTFPAGFEPVSGFAIVDQPELPIPAGASGFGYNAAGQLFSFPLANPAAVTPIGTAGNPAVKGIDFRPGTNTLYSFTAAGPTAQLSTINLSTGAVSLVGSGFATVGTAPAAYTLDSNAQYGFDFNPTTLQPDGTIRIRLVNSDGVNLRLHSDTGGVAAVDGSLAYSTGGPANFLVSGAAYTNTDTARTSATPPATSLYYLDTLNDALVISPAANSGVFTAVGPLGADVGSNTGFDILSTQGGNIGFITVDAGSGNVTLHTVDLVTGAASPAIGTFPAGFAPVGGFAIGMTVPAPPDVTKPTVSIRKFSGKTVTRKRSIVLRGNASDDIAVDRVLVKIGKSPFRPARGAERWNRRVALAEGRTVVRVVSFDAANNRSRASRVVFVRE